jgi:alkylation response protein AidB-like acyl-CoA dehydrogenase
MLTQEKTTAKLSDDGKYYITEWQKMWITNAGFADTQVCLPG